MSNVTLDRTGIRIGGEAKILLCSSLFYFRIPRGDWAARMKQLRGAGYNCADVYFPWNFHELRPGEWHFDGLRDVDAFLALAAENGLYVIARPGPYICSEWDGGALPVWLSAQAPALRQNDPAYLACLDVWLGQILPRIAAHESGRGGSVVAVQLENELDYFPCREPAAYMAHLRDTARRCGITVPLTACAGECDVQGAGGDTPGVHPTFNVYTPDNYGHLEDQLAHMREMAGNLGTPLLVTETDRGHDKLKRELAGGARLISPYNQVGGTDVDLGNGISNWARDPEKPLALMATDYDFDSMITVDGRQRQSLPGGRLLGALIAALGPHLAQSEPDEADFAVACDFPTPLRTRENGEDTPFFSLLRMDCGQLLGVTNLGNQPGTARFARGGDAVCVPVEPLATRLLPLDLSLAPWGCGGRVAWAEAEIVSLDRQDGALSVTLAGPAGSRAAFDLAGRRVIVTGDGWTRVGDGLRARILPDRQAAEAELPLPPAVLPLVTGIRTLAAQTVTRHEGVSARAYAKALPDGVRAMEDAGQYRGDVFYEFDSPDDSPLLFERPADFLWAAHGTRCAAMACDGAGVVVPGARGPWRLRVQSWGHANFDDVRQPSLVMGSRKGVAGVVRIRSSLDITDQWLIQPLDKPSVGQENAPGWGIMSTSINTWSYPASPMTAVYTRRIFLDPACDRFFLRIERAGNARLAAWVNGREAGPLRPSDPFIDLTAAAGEKGGAELRLRIVRRFSHETLGQISLLSGQAVRDARMAGLDAEGWASMAPTGAGERTTLPLTLAAGQETLLTDFLPQGGEDGGMLVIDGRGIETTLLAGGHVCGRVLSATPGYPEVRGGSSRRMYLPAEWAREHPRLHVCGLMDGGVLTAITLEKVDRGAS